MKNQLDMLELQSLTADQLQHVTGGNIDITIKGLQIGIHIETDINFYLNF